MSDDDNERYLPDLTAEERRFWVTYAFDAPSASKRATTTWMSGVVRELSKRPGVSPAALLVEGKVVLSGSFGAGSESE